MKTELVDYNQEKKRITPPLLAKHKFSSLVVLFHSLDSGMVVIGTEEHPTGKYCKAWTGYDNPKAWEILPPGAKVVLENT
jgi:hypothetical protein